MSFARGFFRRFHLLFILAFLLAGCSSILPIIVRAEAPPPSTCKQDKNAQNKFIHAGEACANGLGHCIEGRGKDAGTLVCQLDPATKEEQEKLKEGATGSEGGGTQTGTGQTSGEKEPLQVGVDPKTLEPAPQESELNTYNPDGSDKYVQQSKGVLEQYYPGGNAQSIQDLANLPGGADDAFANPNLINFDQTMRSGFQSELDTYNTLNPPDGTSVDFSGQSENFSPFSNTTGFGTADNPEEPSLGKAVISYLESAGSEFADAFASGVQGAQEYVGDALANNFTAKDWNDFYSRLEFGADTQGLGSEITSSFPPGASTGVPAGSDAANPIAGGVGSPSGPAAPRPLAGLANEVNSDYATVLEKQEALQNLADGLGAKTVTTLPPLAQNTTELLESLENGSAAKQAQNNYAYEVLQAANNPASDWKPSAQQLASAQDIAKQNGMPTNPIQVQTQFSDQQSLDAYKNSPQFREYQQAIEGYQESADRYNQALQDPRTVMTQNVSNAINADQKIISGMQQQIAALDQKVNEMYSPWDPRRMLGITPEQVTQNYLKDQIAQTQAQVTARENMLNYMQHGEYADAVAKQLTTQATTPEALARQQAVLSSIQELGATQKALRDGGIVSSLPTWLGGSDMNQLAVYNKTIGEFSGVLPLSEKGQAYIDYRTGNEGPVATALHASESALNSVTGAFKGSSGPYPTLLDNTVFSNPISTLSDFGATGVLAPLANTVGLPNGEQILSSMNSLNDGNARRIFDSAMTGLNFAMMPGRVALDAAQEGMQETLSIAGRAMEMDRGFMQPLYTDAVTGEVVYGVPGTPVPKQGSVGLLSSEPSAVAGLEPIPSNRALVPYTQPELVGPSVIDEATQRVAQELQLSGVEAAEIAPNTVITLAPESSEVAATVRGGEAALGETTEFGRVTPQTSAPENIVGLGETPRPIVTEDLGRTAPFSEPASDFLGSPSLAQKDAIADALRGPQDAIFEDLPRSGPRVEPAAPEAARPETMFAERDPLDFMWSVEPEGTGNLVPATPETRATFEARSQALYDYNRALETFDTYRNYPGVLADELPAVVAAREALEAQNLKVEDGKLTDTTTGDVVARYSPYTRTYQSDPDTLARGAAADAARAATNPSPTSPSVADIGVIPNTASRGNTAAQVPSTVQGFGQTAPAASSDSSLWNSFKNLFGFGNPTPAPAAPVAAVNAAPKFIPGLGTVTPRGTVNTFDALNPAIAARERAIAEGNQVEAARQQFARDMDAMRQVAQNQRPAYMPDLADRKSTRLNSSH